MQGIQKEISNKRAKTYMRARKPELKYININSKDQTHAVYLLDFYKQIFIKQYPYEQYKIDINGLWSYVERQVLPVSQASFIILSIDEVLQTPAGGIVVTYQFKTNTAIIEYLAIRTDCGTEYGKQSLIGELYKEAIKFINNIAITKNGVQLKYVMSLNNQNFDTDQFKYNRDLFRNQQFRILEIQYYSPVSNKIDTVLLKKISYNTKSKKPTVPKIIVPKDVLIEQLYLYLKYSQDIEEPKLHMVYKRLRMHLQYMVKSVGHHKIA